MTCLSPYIASSFQADVNRASSAATRFCFRLARRSRSLFALKLSSAMRSWSVNALCIALFALVSAHAEACTCRSCLDPWNAEQFVEAADIVIEAVAVRQEIFPTSQMNASLEQFAEGARTWAWGYEAEYVVIEVFKGDVEPGQRIVLEHPNVNRSCNGVSAYIGMEQLLLVSTRDDGSFFRSPCLVDLGAAAMMRGLREGRPIAGEAALEEFLQEIRDAAASRTN